MIPSPKQEIRLKLLQQRSSLNPGEFDRLNQAIVSRFLGLPQLSAVWEQAELAGNPLKIGLYRALPFELDLSPLESALREKGCEIFYPRVTDPQKKQMQFIAFPSSDKPLWISGAYGIEEPHPELNEVCSCLDLVFVPGVIFGEGGQRIGRGGGYYDRFLAQSPSTLRISLAFDFQVLPDLRQDPWDQPIHWIVTESKEFSSPFVTQWLEQKGSRNREPFL